MHPSPMAVDACRQHPMGPWVALIVLLLISAGCATSGIHHNGPGVSGVGHIALTAGDTVRVKMHVDDDRITAVERVDRDGDLEFTLRWEDSNTLLKVTSEREPGVKYDIYLIDIHGRRHYTSSCPVFGGMSAYEHWPYPIEVMEIENFRIIDAQSGEMRCE